MKIYAIASCFVLIVVGLVVRQLRDLRSESAPISGPVHHEVSKSSVKKIMQRRGGQGDSAPTSLKTINGAFSELSTNLTPADLIDWLGRFQLSLNLATPDVRQGSFSRMCGEIFQRCGSGLTMECLKSTQFFQIANDITIDDESTAYSRLCRLLIEHREKDQDLTTFAPTKLDDKMSVTWRIELARTKMITDPENIVQNFHAENDEVKAALEQFALRQLGSSRPRYALDQFLKNDMPWRGGQKGISQLFSDWIEENPYDASAIAATAPKSPRRDGVVAILVEAIKSTDSEAAKTWADSITDTTMKKRTLEKLFHK